MAKRIRRRKCLSCHEFFVPHPSVGRRQTYCSRPDCQRARKAKNNRKWRERNPDYFKDPLHGDRVRAWRRRHPGYWHREKRKGGPGRRRVGPGPPTSVALQAEVNPQPIERSLVELQLTVTALQAAFDWQEVAFQGLASSLTGTALQAELAGVLAAWYDRGRRLGPVRGVPRVRSPSAYGGNHEADETAGPSRSRPCAGRSETIRLGGPPPGS